MSDLPARMYGNHLYLKDGNTGDWLTYDVTTDDVERIPAASDVVVERLPFPDDDDPE